MTVDIHDIESRLWAAADELRANSKPKSSEYSIPVLGLIFLRHADHRFSAAEAELEGEGTGRRTIGKADYQAKGVMFLPKEARFTTLLNLPEGENIGAAINDAMKAIEEENQSLRGVLPKTYNRLENSTLVELLKLLSSIPVDIEGDAFGKIYEYFLGHFASAEGSKGGEWDDRRLDGMRPVQFSPEDKSLPEVPAEFQTTVLFLGCRRGGVDPVGTAFYVTSSTEWDPDVFPPERLPADDPTDSERYGWLITARHVIEGIQQDSEDGKVLLMVNDREGSRINPYPEVDTSDWWQMPNDEDTGYLADVALLPFIRPNDFAIAPIPIEVSLTPSRMEHAGVSPGVDIVYPGLYYQHSGERRNIPLMRSGTLAAVADHKEPVQIEAKAAEAFAHLVEARSYKGASGSPVFVVLPPARSFRHENKKGTFLRMTTNTEFYLLGLMITHFGLQDLQDVRELVNLGVAVVLDSSYIWKGIGMAVKEGRGIKREPKIV